MPSKIVSSLVQKENAPQRSFIFWLGYFRTFTVKRQIVLPKSKYHNPLHHLKVLLCFYTFSVFIFTLLSTLADVPRSYRVSWLLQHFHFFRTPQREIKSSKLRSSAHAFALAHSCHVHVNRYITVHNLRVSTPQHPVASGAPHWVGFL